MSSATGFVRKPYIVSSTHQNVTISFSITHADEMNCAAYASGSGTPAMGGGSPAYAALLGPVRF